MERKFDGTLVYGLCGESHAGLVKSYVRGYGKGSSGMGSVNKVIAVVGGKSLADDLLFPDDVVESSMSESFEHQAYDILIDREVDDSVDRKQVFRDFVSGKRSNRRW